MHLRTLELLTLHYNKIVSSSLPHPTPLSKFYKKYTKEELKICKVDDCYDIVYARGLCKSHGRKPCLVEGCNTKAKARGVCDKHGAKGPCRKIYCSSNAQRIGGYCRKHGVKILCYMPGCSTPARDGRSVCTKHGAYGVYGTDASSRNGRRVYNDDDDHDFRNNNEGGRRVYNDHDFSKQCVDPGCSSDASSARGLCDLHEAEVFCGIPGCVYAAVRRGVCQKHGAYGLCTFGDCMTAAAKTGVQGMCLRHSSLQHSGVRRLQRLIALQEIGV